MEKREDHDHTRGRGEVVPQSQLWSRGAAAGPAQEAGLDPNRGKKWRMDVNLHAFKQGERKLRETA